MTDVRIIYLHEAVLRRVPRIFSEDLQRLPTNVIDALTPPYTGGSENSQAYRSECS